MTGQTRAIRRHRPRHPGRRPRRSVLVLGAVLAGLVAGATPAAPAPPVAAVTAAAPATDAPATDPPATDPSTNAATVDVPKHSAVLIAMKRAADYYGRTHTVATGARNGWSWGTYFDGSTHLFHTAGDQKYLEQAIAWGASTGWSVPCARTLNPDCIKAGQVYHDLSRLDPRPSLSAMDAQMAGDLTGLPLRQYYWVDALYMGLPDWAHWARRTGDEAYLEKMDALFAHVRDDGLTTVFPCADRARGLYDPAERLWYRDCRYVGARDSAGKKIFWARGNGWVIAAMAQTHEALPPGDPRAAQYAEMLVGMADRLRTLQGSDGLWRSSLLNPAVHPQPETSGTGLIAYAIGYGIRSGLLDRATYVPVLARAWHGLTTVSLEPDGFVSNCQFVGFEPAAPYTGSAPRVAATASSAGTLHADSPPFCVGAFLLAGSEMARLTGAATVEGVTATAQQVGNGAPRAVDGDMTTRWSAKGFPQSLTVDLGVVRPVSDVQVVPYLDRAYRYRVETSADGTAWSVAVDRTASRMTSGTTVHDIATPVSARYVRLTVTGVARDVTTWVSIREFSVHGR